MHQGGAKKDKRDRRDYHIGGVQSAQELPIGYRVPDRYPVKDQNGFGSCTAQATAAHKQIQEGIELSARFLYSQTKRLEGNTDWGAYTRNAFKVLKEVGAAAESDYPEVHMISELDYLDWNKVPLELVEGAAKHKSRTYWRIDNDFESIKQAIYVNKQIVVISVPWYNSYMKPVYGRLEYDPKSGQRYGHAIAVVGWQGDYLILKNSWGILWGENGICYFHKSFPIWDAWISLDMPEKLPVQDRYGFPRNYPMEKLTAFNPWLIRKIKRLPNNLEINGLWYGHWDFAAVFRGRVGDEWLFNIKRK